MMTLQILWTALYPQDALDRERPQWLRWSAAHFSGRTGRARMATV